MYWRSRLIHARARARQSRFTDARRHRSWDSNLPLALARKWREFVAWLFRPLAPGEQPLIDDAGPERRRLIDGVTATAVTASNHFCRGQ
ncbi:MAG: hypothetical protein UU95_C0037G0003 [Parcubacteria group bacterium GW2011_GWC2_42_12]|nr:MAG: hypothetical protein UU95_C0037G0003 [Parcubacteria group bacterium GW2011_GWC2_42_12]